MKNLHYIIFILCFALCSCKKQNIVETLPVDKLYILEYRYMVFFDKEESYVIFHVIGFSEVNKNFNVKNAELPFVQLINDSIYNPYYNSHRDSYYNEETIQDSLRSKIANVLLKYQTDTTFLYQGKGRIYDGNKYRFIMQKHNRKDITIKFEPRFLPKDLEFVYLNLYENREKLSHNKVFDINTLNEMHEMFKNQVQDDSIQIRGTIKFTPPIIIKD